VIPVNLRLRNFMCYRGDVSLSFEGLHLACLCGENGHGKSALLDAITWALWGQARARSDDELIYDNDLVRDMEVEFEFLAEGARYRVLRKRVKGKTGRPGQSVLELQVAGGDGYRSITGGVMRETQQKITGVLRLSYETFVNSAFLVQGRADAFTIKQPGERKRVLADILGLSFYDALEERARELGREQERRETEAAAAIAELGRQIEQRPLHEQRLREARFQLEELSKELAACGHSLDSLREERRGLQLQQERALEIKQRVEQMTRDQGELQRRAEALGRDVEAYRALLAGRADVEAGYARLQAARALNDDLARALSRVLELTEQKAVLERAIERARAALEAEETALAREVQRLSRAGEARPRLEAEMEQARAVSRALSADEQDIEQRRQSCQQLAVRLQGLRATAAQLNEDIVKLGEKLDLLTGEETRCPVCGSDLDAQGRESIRAHYEQERASKLELLAETEAEALAAAKSCEAQQADLHRAEGALARSREEAYRRIAALEKDLDAAQQASRELAPAQTALRALDERLGARDYAASERAQLDALKAEIAALGYDAARHDGARREIQELSPFERRQRELEQAERALPQDEAELESAHARLERLAAQAEREAAALRSLEAALIRLPELERELRRVEAEESTLRARQAEAQRAVGAAEEQLETCRRLEALRNERSVELREARREKGVYNELALAFGRRGIQALLIEAALPEIEEEANRLLGRMTDGRMNVKLESQRSTRKGEPIETLDILIADELGTRSYELYSGGEAFRINFALRIALSRLLARRAGAPLPTLVIDEGFGTQDTSGRQKLVEAINAIQDDFEKIIVITHIEELKDAFPNRISVTKTHDGSTVTVS